MMTSLFYDMLNHFVICVGIIFLRTKKFIIRDFFFISKKLFIIYIEREREWEREREISNISMIVK